MAKGKTKSKRTLEERRAEAFECFAQGMNDSQTARIVKVSRPTVAAYRDIYEKRLHERAATNPKFLREVVANTMRSLEELDRIRADAWEHMRPRKHKHEVECPDCQAEFTITLRFDPSDDVRSKYMGHLLKAQEQRGKLLGVLGVKQEMFIAIMQVKVVADHLLAFMGNNLCADDRAKLEEFLMTPELREYVGAPGVLDAIEADVIEDREDLPV